MSMRHLILGLTLTLAASSSAFAAGFGISEFDSSYSGRAYSGSALAEGPSAVYWNPAGITRLEGLQLNLGIAGIMPRFEYVPVENGPGEKVKSDTAISTPPSFSLTYKLGNKEFRDLSLGLGFYVPYGSAFAWPDDWAGRQGLREISLLVFEITPTLAFKLTDVIAIGGGLRIAPGSVYLRRAVGFGSTAEGEVELAGKATGVGGDFGIAIGPLDRVSLAFNYRTRLPMKFEGESNFTFPAPFDTEADDREVEAKIDLPDKYVFGLAVEVLPKQLTLTGDVTYERWSSYRQLRIDFLNEDGSRDVQKEIKDSKDIMQVKVGAEYKIADVAAVRAGYLYDPTITLEEYVGGAPPDSNTHLVSLGGSYYYGNWLGIHAHAALALFAERTSLTSSFPATWRGGYGGSKAILFGLSLSAKLDAGPVLE
jgi:long-chain fatty acid transport protein